MRFPRSDGSRAIARLFAAALIAAGAAGCSDAKRFGENTFTNPFARREAANPPPAEAAPLGRVDAQPLGAQSAGPLPPPTAPAPSYSPNYSPGYGPPRDTTGSLAADRAGPAGGITVTVAPGDTVGRIARRYRVSPAAIVRENHLNGSGAIQVGQRLLIPGRHAEVRPFAATPSPPAAVHHPRSVAAAAGGVHVVAPGETLSSVAHLYRQPRSAIANANDIAPDAKLAIGQRLTIPAAKSTRLAAGGPAHAQAAAGTATRAAAPSHSQPPQRVATAAAGVPLAASEAAGAKPDASPDSPSSAGGFRWPVRGRVIAGFGSEANGQHNDGINLAVPEGTSIKAAEEGTVAYAGNELKGYGNLILLRHSNGFVTAYAHAAELLVKRGDQVKRGQIIARAGQTGSVTSPQLHFEIRKGATPVDPMHYLSGA
jgi:murein DD-endopeptidase MepM/ murein hydrolase activator NlpD